MKGIILTSKTLYMHTQMLSDIKKHVEQFKQEKFIGVVGLARGGLVPAVYISHALGIPLKTIEYSSKKGAGDKVNSNVLPEWLSNGKYLVVDDIADTGNTLKEVMLHAKDSVSFTLTYKPHSCYMPGYIGTYVENKDYILFSWEI